MENPAPSVRCSHCGMLAPAAAADRPPLDWMSETDPRRGTVWICPGCVRGHVRSIEARLDQEWW